MVQKALQSWFSFRQLNFIMILMIFLVNQAHADEIISSGPANLAGGLSKVQEREQLKLKIIVKQNTGILKPELNADPVWDPFHEESSSSVKTVVPASASEAARLPSSQGLPAPQTTVPQTTESSAAQASPSETNAPQQGVVVEEKIDLRPPKVSDSTDEDDEAKVEPSWLNPFVDDHLYLWNENREALELLFDNGSGFGMTSLGFDSSLTGGDGPFWANIKFSWHFLEGPLQPDIRSQTYDLSIEVNHAMQLNETWGLHMQFAPTWATDWDNKSKDAFRLIGGGLVTMKYDQGVTFLLGAMALDRPDLPVVPTAGVRIWGDELEIDLVIPRPRIAWKLSKDDDEEESWFYVAGEIGGGSWAVERELNRKDILGYRDHRLLVGWEAKKIDGTRQVFELGWVFDRKLEMHRYGGSQDLGETFLLRWGQTY